MRYATVLLTHLTHRTGAVVYPYAILPATFERDYVMTFMPVRSRTVLSIHVYHLPAVQASAHTPWVPTPQAAPCMCSMKGPKKLLFC